MNSSVTLMYAPSVSRGQAVRGKGQGLPCSKVLLSGSGIDLPFDDDDAVIGFFTTRLIRAADLASAEALARELVLSEWRPGGTYAQANRGAIPALFTEQAFPVGCLQGAFGRKGSGCASTVMRISCD